MDNHASLDVADILTPRTKVARMLRDIDDQYDNASTPSPTRQPLRKTSPSYHDASPSLNAPKASKLPQSSATARHSLTDGPATASLSVDEDESDGSSVRPNGRAARRMLSKATAWSSSPFPSPPSFLGADDMDDLYSATPPKNTGRKQPAPYSPLKEQTGLSLFVSPTKSIEEESDDELPSNPMKDKLAELVAQKRAERLAREAEEKERMKAAATSSDLPEEAFEKPQDDVDPDIERIMSDATRPSRKASKKAQLEMEKESQRMLRAQALAHKIQVKKKFTTKDLFAKFNYRPTTMSIEEPMDANGENDTSASSAPNSDDIEARQEGLHSTPPSSPPTPIARRGVFLERKTVKLGPDAKPDIVENTEADDNEELPDLAVLVKSAPYSTNTSESKPSESSSKGLKIARIGKAKISHDDSSDDELEILPKLPRHLQIFEKAAGAKGAKRSADSVAIQRLKHLSNFHATEGRQRKKGIRPSVNPQALDSQLRRQAKEQARQQQLERIEELKAKGIEIQTTEDREKEAEAMENLLEKARQDAIKLRALEKAAKKANIEEGAMPASDDEDEDEDYDFGSDEESMDEDDEARVENDGLIEDAAEEMSEDEEDGEDEKEDEESVAEESSSEESPEASVDTGEGEKPPTALPRNSRKSRVIIDEDDDMDDIDSTGGDFTANAAALPTSTTRQDGDADTADSLNLDEQPADDPFAAFNFGMAGNSNLLYSPTQAFNATMQTPTQASQEDSLDVLRYIAPPSASSRALASLDLDTQEDEASELIMQESQLPESQRINLQWETQAPETPGPVGLRRNTSALSETPGWEPSQDRGLPSPWSVKTAANISLHSTAEHETQSTIRLRVSESPAPSQPAPRRGRLVRKILTVEDESDDGGPVESSTAQTIQEKNAFREMARRRKEALTAAERADADKEMRGMMDEQAEESDDEYAGVGGDDYIAPETEQDREMIDSSHVEVDERAIAAHFAERQRARDEAETSRLYKDLTTGVLRRKMGANAFDLEEDEDEMAARRRQMRQQEEARKRKALLKDINVASLAEGKQSKGKDAFLKAIADDGADEDAGGYSDREEESVPTTQDDSLESQIPPTTAGPLLETSGNKRPHRTDSGPDDAMPPAKHRRTGASSLRRPTSLLEVQESVSFLLNDSHGVALSGSVAARLEVDLDEEGFEDVDGETCSEDEFVAAEALRDNDGGFAPNPRSMEAKVLPQAPTSVFNRRTATKTAVVDRLSLKRSSSNMESAHGRTAWASGPTTGGFKVPSLLRRATTNTTSTANERGVSTPSLSRESSGGVKMGGTKKSSLAYQARAEERKAIVEASAKRREENTARIAQLRRNSSALNRGLTGRFE